MSDSDEETASGSSAHGDQIRFVLFGRAYCHLCHDMEVALLALLRDACKDSDYVIDTVDVDEDDGLESRFGERVPVLMCGDKELCHYFLDEAAVRAYLHDIR